MGSWKWTLIALGVVLILMATFAFTNNVMQTPDVLTGAASGTSSFQIIVAIIGFAGIIWGIFQD
jgi:hypothetical protein